MTYSVKYSAQKSNPFSMLRKGQRSHMLNYEMLKTLPKVDLHRHLEGSLRLETLVETAREYNLDVPKEIESLRPFVQVTNEPPDASSFLAKFETLRHFYRSPEMIHRLAYEVVADAARDHVRYLELRFSPQALSRVQGFRLEDVTQWVIDATQEASRDFNMDVGLILTLVRHNSLEQAKQVAEIGMRNQHQGIRGLDLAGDEINFSADPFKGLFVEAHQAGMQCTIHAGEWCGAEAVRFAVEELGAERIGHGVRATEDQYVLDLLRERQIPLEICLTSNLQTASVAHIGRHPLRQFMQNKIPVTLNTDDPRISNITLTNEFESAVQHLHITYEELRQMTFTAIESAFLSSEKKMRLKQLFSIAWKPTLRDFNAPPSSFPHGNNMSH